MATPAQRYSSRHIVIGIAVLALLAVVLFVQQYWAYIRAPGRHDLTNPQRAAALKSALEHGEVFALRETAGMASIHRSEIATVGKSRCIGERECVRVESTRRRPEYCSIVDVNLFCAYEIVDRNGETAAALVKTSRGYFHTPPDLTPEDVERFYYRMQTEVVGMATSHAKLCAMDYCVPGALLRFKPPTKPPAPVGPDAESRARCRGVLVKIVGRGNTCIDPGDPAERELQDCRDGFCGPVMVVLPKGRYVRGTSDSEILALRRDFPDRTYLGKEEAPAREVTIDYHLAVARFEITFDDWDACRTQEAKPCAEGPNDAGGWRGSRPVVGVSWDDITREYLPWLNARLGLSGGDAYRLLTDAEWEYAARAGTTTRYASGDTIATTDANYSTGPPGAPQGNTVAVGSFKPNAFGLHDMHGNVAEWVADCFSFMDSPADLPTDGSAMTTDKWRSSSTCASRAWRGGSYVGAAADVRAAVRGSAGASTRHRTLGFRVARTLGSRP